jgi:curli biogenesis system outer membrane secretion channel CsgG
VVQGPAVRENVTPLEDSFVCMAQALQATGKPPMSISVGNVKDYTGKFSEADGGNPITQGGALMVTSALGKLGDAVKIRERFDTQITEVELAYLSKRYLGDGERHVIRENGQGLREVPWLPYTGGSILQSDYFIVGGITELNYNIQSGGAQLQVDGGGPKGRVFTVNVAVDLRIVDTQTLEVIKTTSFQKQVTGYEVGVDLFRFFASLLVDLSAGVKSQEPIQLAVRTTLELAVLELVGYVGGVDYHTCVSSYLAGPPSGQEARQPPITDAAMAASVPPPEIAPEAFTPPAADATQPVAAPAPAAAQPTTTAPAPAAPPPSQAAAAAKTGYGRETKQPKVNASLISRDEAFQIRRTWAPAAAVETSSTSTSFLGGDFDDDEERASEDVTVTQRALMGNR